METRTTTPITTVMVLLEEKLRQQVRQDKPLLVAIDGRCASGKAHWQKICKAAGLQRDPHG